MRTMDQLILMPEAEAVRAVFNDINRVVIFRLLLLASLVAMFAGLIMLADEKHALLPLPALSLIFIRALFVLRRKRFLEQHFRVVLSAFLLVELLLFKAVLFNSPWTYHPTDWILLPLLLLFRLPVLHLTILVAVLWSGAAGRDIWSFLISDTALEPKFLITYTGLCMAVFGLSRFLTLRKYHQFLPEWRHANQRHRERLRMREELDEARRIQLSMLPRSDPNCSWLDIAGISIPASEVGGDYYEFFRVSESRQTVVVADVAGHGVASGLLLAGVRSCLYLLKEIPTTPAEVLTKLDKVVRETTGRREFVTMVYANFDHETSRLTASLAGHPPILHYRVATHDVVEVGINSLPLGTAIKQPIGQLDVSFEYGDIFLAYTDGIAETVNGQGELYGTDRLAKRLERTAHDRTAKEIRDTLLGDVWSFKADGTQTDDITLVVIKSR